MKKYTSDEALRVIGLSKDELEFLIRTGKKLSKASTNSAVQPSLELVFVEDGAYYKVQNYYDLYLEEDVVLIKPILLDEEIDGMKKNSGWIANLRKTKEGKESKDEIDKIDINYLRNSQGVAGYPGRIIDKNASSMNEFLHRGHLMANEIIRDFINKRIQDKRCHMFRSKKNRHNIYAQFKQSNCYYSDCFTRKGQSYFEKKIIDYLKSKEGSVNYEVRALFKSPSDKVPRANLLCARFYDSCGLLNEQETFCVVIPNMGSLGRDYSSIASYKFSYEDGLMESGKGN